jgi:hypothetical protein
MEETVDVTERDWYCPEVNRISVLPLLMWISPAKSREERKQMLIKTVRTRIIKIPRIEKVFIWK